MPLFVSYSTIYLYIAIVFNDVSSQSLPILSLVLYNNLNHRPPPPPPIYFTGKIARPQLFVC